MDIGVIAVWEKAAEFSWSSDSSGWVGVGDGGFGCTLLCPGGGCSASGGSPSVSVLRVGLGMGEVPHLGM